MAEEELRMPFWSHLAELRKRIVVSLIAVAIGFAVCFNFSEDLLAILLIPMNMKIGCPGCFSRSSRSRPMRKCSSFTSRR